MPALPWKKISAEPPTTEECTVMASRLPLQHYRHMAGFLRRTLKIRRQLAETPGLIGYALDADLLHKTFWTLSAWSSQDALDRFACTNPHRDVVTATRPLMEASRFVFWTWPSHQVPGQLAGSSRPTTGFPAQLGRAPAGGRRSVGRYLAQTLKRPRAGVETR
jgi:quinol monooxygenase YgiN